MTVIYTGVDQHGIVHQQCELPFGRAEVFEFVESCKAAGWVQVQVWEGYNALGGLPENKLKPLAAKRGRHTWYSVVVPVPDKVEAAAQ